MICRLDSERLKLEDSGVLSDAWPRRFMRLLREIIITLFKLLPKNRYTRMPTTGSNSSTVTHASERTGLRFSDTTTIMHPIAVMMYSAVNT